MENKKHRLAALDMTVSMLWLSLALILCLFCLAFETSKAEEPSEEEPIAIQKKKASTLTPEVALGKALFKNNCASCHNKNMQDDLVGPALGGVTERWSAYPKEDLYNWIRNSRLLEEKGHPKAKELINEWDDEVMTSFPNLTNEEIKAILAYIDL